MVLRGWRIAPATVLDGIASVELSPEQPFVSLPGFWINGRVAPSVTLLGRSMGQDIPICLEYLTINRVDWISDPTLCQTIKTGDFASYISNGGQIPSLQNSRITQLRLVPAEPGTLEIDSIDVQKTGQMLDFNSEDELLSLGIVNQLDNIVVTQGVLRMESIGDDPYFDIPIQAPILAESSPQVEIRMKVSDGFGAQLFFKPEHGLLSEETSLFFEIIADGKFHTYTLELASLPAWTGKISKIRLDPTDTTAIVEIDYILIPTNS